MMKGLQQLPAGFKDLNGQNVDERQDQEEQDAKSNTESNTCTI